MKSRLFLTITVATLLLGAIEPAFSQVFPPGQFSIDGIPVSCGGLPTILTPNIPDVAMNNGQAILINPNVAGSQPTVLKLFWYAHECGHSVVGANESAADCWAIRTGRDQGWFPPNAFGLLINMFKNNPGDMTHAPGPARVNNMIQCYKMN
jgi:hypothetical protein